MAENISGKDCKVLFTHNNTPIVIKVKDFSIEEVAVEVDDGICGDDRDELQIITKYFKFSGQVYQSDADLLRAYLSDIKNDDASITQLNKSIGIRELYHNGKKAAFVLKECTRGPFKRSSGGRTERVMMNLDIRGRYFEEVKVA